MLHLLCSCNLRNYPSCSCSSDTVFIVPINTRMGRGVSVIYTELARDISGKTCVGRIQPLYPAGLVEYAGVGDGGVWEKHVELAISCTDRPGWMKTIVL